MLPSSRCSTPHQTQTEPRSGGDAGWVPVGHRPPQRANVTRSCSEGEPTKSADRTPPRSAKVPPSRIARPDRRKPTPQRAPAAGRPGCQMVRSTTPGSTERAPEKQKGPIGVGRPDSIHSASGRGGQVDDHEPLAAAQAELVAVGIGQLDGIVIPGAAEHGLPPARPVDRPRLPGRHRSEQGRSAAGSSHDFGATGGPPHATLVPPCGDWIAVSWSSSHTRGQPSASAQKSPTCRVPSQASSPRKPQPARNELSGSITQNSLPSGSASTIWPSSGS